MPTQAVPFCQKSRAPPNPSQTLPCWDPFLLLKRRIKLQTTTAKRATRATTIKTTTIKTMTTTLPTTMRKDIATTSLTTMTTTTAMTTTTIGDTPLIHEDDVYYTRTR